MKKRILILVAALFASCYAYSMTVADIISQVRLLEKDNNSASYRYTNQYLIDRINIVQDEICAKSACLQKRAYITTTAGTQEYRVPSDCINVIRVGYYIAGSTSAYKKLAWTSIGGQDHANSTWQNKASGLPLEYYRRAEYVGLVPAPSSSCAGESMIQLDYNVRAASVTLTADIPFNDSYNLYAFHQAIIYGVVALCEWDKGDMDKYKTAQAVYADWLAKIKEIYYTEPDKNINFTK